MWNGSWIELIAGCAMAFCALAQAPPEPKYGYEVVSIKKSAGRTSCYSRTKVLNDELDDVFRRWYPRFRPQPRTTSPEQKVA